MTPYKEVLAAYIAVVADIVCGANNFIWCNIACHVVQFCNDKLLRDKNVEQFCHDHGYGRTDQRTRRF